MDYGVMQEQLEKAQKFHADAINLKFRAFFKMPSFVEHINKYFNLLQNSLKVNDLYDHFTSELENVTDICNTYVERIKARDTKIKEKRSAYKEIFVSIFSEIVALVVLFNSSWDLIEKVMGRTISFWSIQLLVVFGTLLSSIIPVVISVCSKANDIKAINAALNKEMKDKLVEDDKLRKKRKKLRKIITKN
jgi:ABC-type multidrug transport system fused ATPase/permease subunit